MSSNQLTKYFSKLTISNDGGTTIIPYRCITSLNYSNASSLMQVNGGEYSGTKEDFEKISGFYSKWAEDCNKIQFERYMVIDELNALNDVTADFERLVAHLQTKTQPVCDISDKYVAITSGD